MNAHLNATPLIIVLSPLHRGEGRKMLSIFESVIGLFNSSVIIEEPFPLVTTCLSNNYSSISIATKGHRRIFGAFRVCIAAHTRPACSLDCSSQTYESLEVCCCICRKGRDLHIGNRDGWAIDQGLNWVSGIVVPRYISDVCKEQIQGWLKFSDSLLFTTFFFFSFSFLFFKQL